MGSVPQALRDEVAVVACAEVEGLQQDEAFTSVTSFCEQCFHVCRILREEHTPYIPLELIG
jgi:hypothetical protein